MQFYKIPLLFTELLEKKDLAGAKKKDDPLDRVTLLVRRSVIIGAENIPYTPKDEKGKWKPEYKEKIKSLKEMLYETIEFVNADKINYGKEGTFGS